MYVLTHVKFHNPKCAYDSFAIVFPDVIKYLIMRQKMFVS